MSPKPRAGAFRGLAPYEEDEASLLFGRESERTQLLELVRHRGVGTILLTGEVASGKTSLLRAGVYPAALAAGFSPIYLELGFNLEQQFGQGLARLVGRPIGPDESAPAVLADHVQRQQGGAALLLLDHVELLLWMEEPEVQAIRQFLNTLERSGAVKLVVTVDRGNLHALAKLAEGLAAIPAAHTVTLGRWNKERVAQVLEQTVLAGGGYMEAGLPEVIAQELCAAGPVLPAAIQVVGHAAVLHRITRPKAFSRVGGATALSAFYVEQLAGRAGAWRARRVLAVLSEQPNPRLRLALTEIARGAGLPKAVTTRLLAGLEEQGLVRSCVEGGAGLTPGGNGNGNGVGYTILHPYLRQPIRDFVAPVLRGRARAKLALRRRLHAKQLLRPQELLQVASYLGNALDDQERTRVQRSVRVWSVVAAVLLAIPLCAVAGLYVALSSSVYLHTAPGVPGLERVVLRRGRPSLRPAAALFPGQFDGVEMDTGLALGSVPAALAEQVRSRVIVGPLKDDPATAVPDWFARLAEPLAPARRAALLLLAGDAAAGQQLLLAAVKQPAERRQAVEVAALLSTNDELTRSVLVQGLADARPVVRRAVVERASRLPTVAAVSVLKAGATDADSQVRLAALRSLRRLGSAHALPVVALRLTDADGRVQHEALMQLRDAAPEQPLDVLEILLGLTGRADQQRLAPIAPTLERLQRDLARKTPRKLAERVASRLESQAGGLQRAALLEWLVAVADRVKPEAILPAIKRLMRDKDPAVRAAATSLFARFGDPETAMALLQELARTRLPRGEATLMRRAAAIGLGLVPRPLDKTRWDLLKGMIKDRDVTVRAAAVESLLRVGAVGLAEVARAMRQGPPDLAQAALAQVCGHQEPNARVATTLLAAAWKIKRAKLREQALGCAQSLAQASPRLGMWLADQAALDKDREVKRAGAAAAALALQKGGKKFLRLARLYLRDDDPQLRTAMLQELARRPPPGASFLYELVERLVKDPSPAVRTALSPVLVLAAPSPAVAVRQLIPLLQDPDAKVWRAALEAAGTLSPGGAVAELDQPVAQAVARGGKDEALLALQVARRLGLAGPLGRAAAHPIAAVRTAAVGAVTPSGDRRAALGLLDAALRESDLAPRLAALRAAAEQSADLGAAVVPLLWRSTFAREPSERWAAFEALGKVRGKGVVEAVRFLLEGAGDPSEERRRMAITALGALAFEEPSAAPALIGGALDGASDVRTAAQAALARYLGRYCPEEELWRLLSGSGRDALARRTVVLALAWRGRREGGDALARRAKALGPAEPLVVRMGARLALALARSSDPPEGVVAWLFGW
ncbi:MAG: HEAT repeat domain-containing protein [Deltaproteobacteria bacterium]|nr:HEAT repeat domain-containing protein [Deltaproteobacteria bacterium]